MKVLIVSGGIGSGKSTVCRMLETIYGAPVYDADMRVKNFYTEKSDLLPGIENALGERFRGADGIFLPSVLASRIFSDSEALRVVESLVFPVLTEDFYRWRALNADKRFVVLESATILEKPDLAGLGDYVVVVDAPVATRVQRAIERDGVTYESVIGRVNNQKLMNEISSGMIPPSVDFVIINDGSLEALSENVKKCIESLDI
jgi:dephospho-CoA kinase